MKKRVIIYTRAAETDPELLRNLRQAVEDRGETVAGTFVDDPEINGRGKYQGWREMLAKLDEADQVVVATAGDLPGRVVNDLLKLLTSLRNHDVALRVHHEQIDTSETGFALLDLIAAYRAAKLSQAIKAGQATARAAGKRIGRPPIPPRILIRIQASLAQGFGIRATGRKLNVSAASVMNVARSMRTPAGAEAA